MTVQENKGNNNENNSVATNQRRIGLYNYREGVEEKPLQNNVIFNGNIVECDKEMDPHEEFFTQFDEVDDEVGNRDNEANEENKDGNDVEGEEAKEQEEEKCNDYNDEYNIVDDIEPVLKSCYSDSSTTQNSSSIFQFIRQFVI